MSVNVEGGKGWSRLGWEVRDLWIYFICLGQDINWDLVLSPAPVALLILFIFIFILFYLSILPRVCSIDPIPSIPG